MAIPETLNMDFIEAQYKQWKADPDSISRDWRFFFEGFEIGGGLSGADTGQGECTIDQALRQARVEALKYRYRDIGHLLACLDPLSACPVDHPLLDLPAFGLTLDDLETPFFTRRFARTQQAPLKEIVKALKATYCRSVGVEYMHLQDPDERRWLQDRMEPVQNQPEFDSDTKIRILNKLYQAAIFEAYLNKKYMGQTRFSLEGGESLIPMLDQLFLRASENGCEEIILGMAHRGRLNVLTNVLYKPYEEIFREFINSYDPDSQVGSGDVKYHNGYLTDIRLANGHRIRAFLVNNPSHLESVDPVVEGIARGRQDHRPESSRTDVLPVLIHGDAAFAGQGVVMETLNLSQLEGYTTGGTIHIIINNQIGYTTLPEDARSTRYSTDVAKMLMIPIFHVHGENPEAVVHVIQLASDYRMKFGKDVVVDLVCYRRYGHNEGDEPYFTQPLMYEQIRQRPPVHKIYGQGLINEKIVTQQDVDTIEQEIHRCLEEAFQSAQTNPKRYPKPRMYEAWENVHGHYSHDPVDTRVSEDILKPLGEKLNTMPDGFHLHNKLQRLFHNRLESIHSGTDIDWANAEALAFATLLREGFPIRLSGQDCGRGTFSQRHCVVTDTRSGEPYIPLNHIAQDQARFQVFNSSLSEMGVLGFEYGYALTDPMQLVLWEAQFGDFANNAQSVIDLYIAAGESKWQLLNGLVMLLPHGWEGLGPEHSSARLERFLQLCAEDNLIVCNATTPAQYFHLLRRQIHAPYRKPLILMAPKSLLRNPLAVSEITDLSQGKFVPVLDDPDADANCHTVLFCSGKIYYELYKRRQTLNKSDMAIVRIEQFYPFPEHMVQSVVARFSKARQFMWVQEEPQNMGAWTFIRPYLESVTGKPLGYIGRRASASPATGFANRYRQEQTAILDEAIGGESRR